MPEVGTASCCEEAHPRLLVSHWPHNACIAAHRCIKVWDQPAAAAQQLPHDCKPLSRHPGAAWCRGPMARASSAMCVRRCHSDTPLLVHCCNSHACAAWHCHEACSAACCMSLTSPAAVRCACVPCAGIQGGARQRHGVSALLAAAAAAVRCRHCRMR